MGHPSVLQGKLSSAVKLVRNLEFGQVDREIRACARASGTVNGRWLERIAATERLIFTQDVIFLADAPAIGSDEPLVSADRSPLSDPATTVERIGRRRPDRWCRRPTMAERAKEVSEDRWAPRCSIRWRRPRRKVPSARPVRRQRPLLSCTATPSRLAFGGGGTRRCGLGHRSADCGPRCAP